MKLRNTILLLLLFCSGISLLAQKSTVRATIEPSDILIGEQAIINLEVISPKGRNIIFPLYQDTLIKGIEVLHMLPPDTVITEVMRISQKYVVTSFDSTLYHIPNMLVIDGNDSIRSNDLGLKVSAPQLSDSTLAYLEKMKNQETDSIDFAKLQISDIKDIQKLDFNLFDFIQDYLLIPILVFVALVVIGLILYLVLRKKKKGYFFTPKVILPPHVVALQNLDALKGKKLCLRGMEKEYYTELTDILREYIDTRFGIDAPEMITEDIVAAVHLATETGSTAGNLKQILETADLVKFAKYTPFADENDLSLVNAYLFVNQTKIEETVKPEDAKNEDTAATGSPATEPEKEEDAGNNYTKNERK